MTRRHLIVLSGVLVLLTAVVALAASKSGTPLLATFLPNLTSTGAGVSDDGTATYQNGVDKVQCYFGVNGKDLDVVTYNTPRKLHFVFDTTSSAWKQSGLPADFYAVVDFYGVNYFGPYATMGVGTTAQVHGVLQFYVGRLTYQLDYQSLAAMRQTSTTWLVTSNPSDIHGYPGFSASSQAGLAVIRRNAQTLYGAVNMPIRFEVSTL